MAAPTDRITAPPERLTAPHERPATRGRRISLARLFDPLRRLAATRRFDPARITLTWWLAVSQVLIVLSVAGGISAYAIGRLHDLADEQGKSRVQLAGAMAREDLRRMSEDALTQVRVLAGRSTLERLLSENRPEQLALFLRRFCGADTIDG
ncbi:MAG: hypothetical protein ACREUG_04485, partial [Steroidobacteraceae bacterium]